MPASWLNSSKLLSKSVDGLGLSLWLGCSFSCIVLVLGLKMGARALAVVDVVSINC